MLIRGHFSAMIRGHFIPMLTQQGVVARVAALPGLAEDLVHRCFGERLGRDGLLLDPVDVGCRVARDQFGFASPTEEGRERGQLPVHSGGHGVEDLGQVIEPVHNILIGHCRQGEGILGVLVEPCGELAYIRAVGAQ